MKYREYYTNRVIHKKITKMYTYMNQNIQMKTNIRRNYGEQ